MKTFLQLIKDIVSYNCDVMRIPVPSIRLAAPSKFVKPTIKSAVSSDGKELLINRTFAENKADIPFVWLAISHECRHIWQLLKTDILVNYQTSAEITLLVYNSQLAEVDAWAWACNIVAQKFGIRPTLEKNFGADLWAQIEKRAYDIAENHIY